MLCIIDSLSHIACNRSATSLRPKFRVVAGRLQGGCEEVADWSSTGCRDDLVARRFWLLQVKPLWDQIDRRTFFGGRRQVANLSPTGWRLIVYQLQRLQTIPTQFLFADWSPTSHRPISKKLQTFCNQKQTLKIQSPTSRRSLPNWSTTDRQQVGNHCPITRQ